MLSVSAATGVHLDQLAATLQELRGCLEASGEMAEARRKKWERVAWMTMEVCKERVGAGGLDDYGGV